MTYLHILQFKGDDIIVEYKPKISKSRLELHNIVDWPLDPNQQLYFLIDEGTGAGSGTETECVIKLNMMLRRGKNEEICKFTSTHSNRSVKCKAYDKCMRIYKFATWAYVFI